MGLSDTFKKLIGQDEEQEEFTEEEISKAKDEIRLQDRPVQTFQAQGQKPAEQKKTFSTTGTFKMVVIEPKGFEECPKLVDNLKGRRPVIINLEKIETETARKIFDFLSGATYALNGNVQKVASNIFIFAPESVDIAANQDERGFAFAGREQSPWAR